MAGEVTAELLERLDRLEARVAALEQAPAREGTDKTKKASTKADDKA